MNARIAIGLKDNQYIPSHYFDKDGLITLDVYAKTDFAQTFQDDRDADGKVSTQGFNRQYPITVPGGKISPKNELIFGFIANENSINNPVFIDGYLDAKILDGSTTILDGILIITDYEKRTVETDYEVMIIEKGMSWVDVLKDQTIKSLPFENLDFNDANVIANIQTLNPKYSSNFKYYYAPIFSGFLRNQAYGQEHTYNQWVSEDLSIIIYLRYILSLLETVLFDNGGWTIDSKFIEEDWFLKKAVHILEDFRQPEDDVKINKLSIKTSSDINYTTIYMGDIDFNSIDSDENNLHHIFQDKTTIKKNGLYRFQFGVTFGIYSNKDVIIINSNSTIFIKKNGVLLWSNNIIGINGSTEIYNHSQSIEFPLIENDVITYEIEAIVTNWSGNLAPGEHPDWKSVLYANSTLNVELQKEIFDTTINPSDYIDDRFTGWQLFDDIFKLGNCKVRTDYTTRQIIFDPPHLFYKPRAVAKDWTGKISIHSEKGKLTESKRYFHFLFATDSGDKYYNATRAGGRIGLYDFKFDFLSEYDGKRFKGTSSIPLSMFAGTRMMKVAENTDIVVVTTNEIFGGEIDRTSNFYSIEQEAERTYKFSPRLLHVEGWGHHGSASSFQLNGIDYTDYPIVFSSNRLSILASDTIGSDNDLTFERLFEKHWRDTIIIMNLNGVKISYAVLNTNDITDFDTSYLLKIGHNYYYLKKIEHWLLNEKHLPTSVHLLLDSKNRIL